MPWDESENEKLPAEWLYRPADPQKDTRGRLKLVFKKSRPLHISGHPDKLPFADVQFVRRIFDDLQLPKTFFHISSGTLVLARSHIVRNESGTPTSYEFIAHCPSKQGDWSLALSYYISIRTTSAYLSVDHRIDSRGLLPELGAFHSFAFHPMLIPCIMFSAVLQRSLDRRIAVKSKLNTLEENIRLVTQKAAKTSDEDFQEFNWYFKQLGGMETMFELLERCRREQSSRKGRYQYWRMLYDAIWEGIDYAEDALTYVPRDDFRKAQGDLKQWVAITWMKFESLMARDEDHIARVNDASEKVSTFERPLNGVLLTGFEALQSRPAARQSGPSQPGSRDPEGQRRHEVHSSAWVGFPACQLRCCNTPSPESKCVGANRSRRLSSVLTGSNFCQDHNSSACTWQSQYPSSRQL